MRSGKASIAVLAGRTVGNCVATVRGWLPESRSFRALLRLIVELPHLSDSGEKLGTIERAFAAAFGMPLAVFTPSPGGICVRHHSAAFVPDEADHARASST